MQAKLITFEGIDGAGKSTHIRFVQEWLQARGLAVVQTREPGGTALGERLRTLLLEQPMHVDTEAMLMFAARRESLEQVIRPALARGAWVISDRYADSSYAYQGGGRKLALAKLDALSMVALDGTQPDLTFLFDVAPEVARQRILHNRGAQAGDRFEQEELTFFNAVRAAFLQRAQQEPQRIKVIDSSLSIAAIEQQLQHVLQDLYNSAQSAAGQAT